MKLRRCAAAIISFFCLITFGSIAGATDLNGVYASQPDQCRKIFERRGTSVVFTKMSDIYGSGFIIDDRQIRGKVARCSITKRVQKDDTVNIIANCATDVVLSSTQFSLRILDGNRVSRVFPDMPGMEVTYHRCPPL